MMVLLIYLKNIILFLKENSFEKKAPYKNFIEDKKIYSHALNLNLSRFA